MYLRTLGGLACEDAGLRRPKPLLLLAFLALEGPRTRVELAELFWPNARDPRDSLSGAIRRVHGGHRQLMQVDRDHLQATVDCDAAELRRAARERRFRSVVEMYQGPFLAGIALPLSGEMEEWVYATREHLADLVRRANLELAHEAFKRGNAVAAAQYAENAVGLASARPPGPEELAEVHWLLRVGGSERIVDVEREALDLGFALQGAVRVSPPVVNLPTMSNAFVGRHDERARIVELLTATPIRLLTLHGPGGMGKSRLAVESARVLQESNAFADGTYFAQLEDVKRMDGLPLAIADALFAIPVPRVPVAAQVLGIIGDREILLVIDNFEHLVGGTDLVRAVLERCPNAKLLVTSRRRLNLPAEHVFLIRGMSLGSLDSEGDALKLLRDRVQQQGRSPEFAPEDELAARRVCELVDGSPLAIELAAAWTRVMPLADVAIALSKDVGQFTSPGPLVPERRHSLRGAFDVSWRLLDDAEKVVLRGVSLFQTPFGHVAARIVTGAGVRTIASLVDHALLLQSPDGGLQMHPVSRPFAAEKLAMDPVAERSARDRHAEYFLSRAMRLGDEVMRGGRGKDPWTRFAATFPDIKAAWTHAAVGGGRVDDLIDVARYLVRFGEATGRHREVLGLLLSNSEDGNLRLETAIQTLSDRLDRSLGDLERRAGIQDQDSNAA